MQDYRLRNTSSQNRITVTGPSIELSLLNVGINRDNQVNQFHFSPFLLSLTETDLIIFKDRRRTRPNYTFHSCVGFI